MTPPLTGSMAFSPIYNWLSGPCLTHNSRSISSAPRFQVPNRAHTHPIYQSIPSDSAAVSTEIPCTHDGHNASRRSHRRRSSSLNALVEANFTTFTQTTKTTNNHPPAFNLTTERVFSRFISRRGALFRPYDFTPQNASEPNTSSQDDNNNSVHDYTDNTPLPLVRLVVPLPSASTSLHTRRHSEPITISPVGYKVIPALPQDIKSFNLNNPDMISLRIIGPISIVECLLLLSICTELEHLDVVIDQIGEGLAPSHPVEPINLLTLRIYASCGLRKLFNGLELSQGTEVDVFWDSRLSELQRQTKF